MHILDAGCGPGVYTEWLIEHGADVVALDANENMVRLAKQRLGEGGLRDAGGSRMPTGFFLEDATI